MADRCSRCGRIFPDPDESVRPVLWEFFEGEYPGGFNICKVCSKELGIKIVEE